jgi:hypothetical protein
MFKRVLILAWAVFGGVMFLFVFFPTKAVRIPHILFIRPYMIVLTVVSLVYGIFWLYRQGMKSARDDGTAPDKNRHRFRSA